MALRTFLDRAGLLFRFNNFQGLFRRRQSDFEIITLPNLTAANLLRIQLPGANQLYINNQLVPKEPASGHWTATPDHLEPGENVLAVPPGLKSRPSLEFIEASAPPEQPPGTPHAYEQQFKLHEEVRKDAAGLEIHARTGVEFILNARNLHEFSDFAGSFYGCYDRENRIHRLASWTWCSAMPIYALLNLPVSSGTRSFMDLAVATGQVLHNRWQTDHPTEDGGMLIRWDISAASRTGVVPWRAPNDVSFIASYGFLPLYRHTGDPTYLAAAEEIASWIREKALAPSGRLLVGYREDTHAWDDSWLYVDAGFTARLFSELYQLTNDEVWRDCGTRFTNWFIQAFWTRDYYFRWTWPVKVWHTLRPRVFTRGQAWALDGMLSSFEAFHDPVYLDIAEKSADFLLARQGPDGSWKYISNADDSGTDNKGIPIIAYHLLRLFRITWKKRYLEGARQAVAWCEKNQLLESDDPNAVGGIFAKNKEGAITGKHDIETSFLYAVAYYLVAKELLRASA